MGKLVEFVIQNHAEIGIVYAIGWLVAAMTLKILAAHGRPVYPFGYGDDQGADIAAAAGWPVLIVIGLLAMLDVGLTWIAKRLA